jgi:hypothetical protein
MMVVVAVAVVVVITTTYIKVYGTDMVSCCFEPRERQSSAENRAELVSGGMCM